MSTFTRYVIALRNKYMIDRGSALFLPYVPPRGHSFPNRTPDCDNCEATIVETRIVAVHMITHLSTWVSGERLAGVSRVNFPIVQHSGQVRVQHADLIAISQITRLPLDSDHRVNRCQQILVHLEYRQILERHVNQL